MSLKGDLYKLNDDQTEKALKKFASQIGDKLKQEFNGENEEFLDRLLHQFGSKISRCAWNTAQKWCKWSKDGPVLMPDYTRLYYRKGNTEVLVQEWPPQIRLTKFRGRLALCNTTTDPISDANKLRISRFSLAFPYTIFIFKFRDGTFNDVKMAFSDRPLKRLDEKPLRPYLSNVGNDLKVCLGSSFDYSQLEKGNIVQQAAFVISYFWQAVCTDEWSQNYWNNKSHFQEINDNRLTTLKAWQDASAENPLFVVEDVHWLQHNEENFGDIVVRMFDDDRTASDMSQDIYTVFVDAFLNEVKRTLSENFTNSIGKVSNVTSAQLKQDMDKIIKSL